MAAHVEYVKHDDQQAIVAPALSDFKGHLELAKAH